MFTALVLSDEVLSGSAVIGFTETDAVEVYSTGMAKVARRPIPSPRMAMNTTRIQ